MFWREFGEVSAYGKMGEVVSCFKFHTVSLDMECFLNETSEGMICVRIDQKLWVYIVHETINEIAKRQQK